MDSCHSAGLHRMYTCVCTCISVVFPSLGWNHIVQQLRKCRGLMMVIKYIQCNIIEMIFIFSLYVKANSCSLHIGAVHGLNMQSTVPILYDICNHALKIFSTVSSVDLFFFFGILASLCLLNLF